MRLFVALFPPEDVLEALGEFLAPRQEAGGDLRWTSRDQWHVTLAFMPQVHGRSLDDLTERLTRAAHRRSPFALGLAGSGAFPHPVGARVVWAGVQTTSEELPRLATGVRAAATRSGAQAEGGRFHAHLTLARLRQPADVTRWLRALDGYCSPRWLADQVALVESHLGEGPHRRPRYEVLDTFPLGSAPAISRGEGTQTVL